MPAPWMARTAVVALLSLTLSGCVSGATPTVSEPSTPQPTTTPEPDDQTTTPGEASTPSLTPTPTPTTSVAAVAYVPWGPADPVIPDQYGQLARRDCTGSVPDGEFWAAAFAVCRTLNQGAAWPELSTAPALPDTDNPHEQCLNAELGQMLDAALAWHAENPDATAKVEYPETGSACYRRVYSARQLAAQEDTTDPGAGLVTVEVVIDSTYDLASVSLDGSPLAAGDYGNDSNQPQPGMRTVSIHVAAPEAPTQVTVDLSLSLGGDDRGTATATVDVAAQDDGGATAAEDTASPTDDASASPTDDDTASPTDGTSSDESGPVSADGS